MTSAVPTDYVAGVRTRPAEIASARSRVLAEVEGISTQQGAWRGQEGQWSLQDVIEHLVLAERGGFDLIWSRPGQRSGSSPKTVRGQLAEGYLTDTKVSIAEVAFLLGFQRSEQLQPGVPPLDRRVARTVETTASVATVERIRRHVNAESGRVFLTCPKSREQITPILAARVKS